MNHAINFRRIGILNSHCDLGMQLKYMEFQGFDEVDNCKVIRKLLEQFLKSGNRFSDKNCGKNKELEHSVEPSETKNALEPSVF